MKKSHRHLTHDDRSQIYAHKSNGLSISKTAEQLRADRRTIDREIKCNSDQCGYRFQGVHSKTVERRRATPSLGGRLMPSLW